MRKTGIINELLIGKTNSFIDLAYQGLGDGLEEDVKGIRNFYQAYLSACRLLLLEKFWIIQRKEQVVYTS